MKNRIFLFCLLAALAVSCVKEQQELIQTITDDPVFYATIEGSGDPETRVYADDQLRVLWNADDRVSIFNRTTFNRQYRFTGADGANSGSFAKVPSEDFVTGNNLDYAYSVYPYNENTSISNDGEITIFLPVEQTYRKNSFGLGANTMIAITDEDELVFKNLCGYFAVKLYGNNVAVSSITLKGNNNEYLAGKATVVAATDAVPTIQLDANEATKKLTLNCPVPVTIGYAAETATSFWFVVPPTAFEGGISLLVKDNKNGVFEVSTSGTLEIKRNTLKNSAALKVTPEVPAGNILFADQKVKDKLVAFCDTNDDGEISYDEAEAVTTLYGFKNSDISSFDEFRFFTGLTSLYESIFEGCSQLESICIPPQITSIPKYAFNNCVKLSSIELPGEITYIGYGAFSHCSSLKMSTLPEKLTYLGEHAFYYCTSLESIILPESLTSFNRWAFSNCTALKSVKLPSKLNAIPYGAFSRCSSLIDIEIPSTVKTIGSGAFSSCSSLKTMSIPQGITIIESDTFLSCYKLESISLPSSVVEIRSGAFKACRALSQISIPESVTMMGKECFAFCKELTEVNLPPSINVIENKLFESCEKLNHVSIPLIVTSIGDYAFYRCFALDNLTLPSNLESIGDCAFQSCEKLSDIIIPASVISIGESAFWNCKSFTSFVYPESITEIKDNQLSGCGKLTCVSLPSNVTSIGANAFSYCTLLADISIPRTVSSIGEQAFYYCTNLSSVKLFSENPPAAASNMFKQDNKVIIYVPASAVDSYKEAQYWSDYSNRIQPLAPLPEVIDLGLSVKWASFNLGASSSDGYGDYYAWGEVEPYYFSQIPLTWKDGKEAGYAWSSYKWCMGDSNTMIKYCSRAEYGYDGFTDTKAVLDPEDDAAHIILGGKWCMPTDADWTELRDNCSWTWTTNYNGTGVAGYVVKSEIASFTSNSIFLPATGYRYDTNLNNVGSMVAYWSSSLYPDAPRNSFGVFLRATSITRATFSRVYGQIVRPVCAKD